MVCPCFVDVVMSQRRALQSVTTRLAMCIIAVGVMLSAAAAVLTWQRSQTWQTLDGAGQAASQPLREARVRDEILYQTMLIAAASLGALLLTRRYIGGPLDEIVELVDVGARHEPFHALARQQTGEIRRLASAMGELVEQAELARRHWARAAEPGGASAGDAAGVETGERAALRQTGRQLQSLPRLSEMLGSAENVDALLERAATQIFDFLGVNAVGVAVRSTHGGKRTQQVVHRGTQGHLLEPNRAVVRDVEKHLLPDALAQPDLLFWPDLDVADTKWSASFKRAGLTCLAAVGVRGSHDAQGVVWIAQRGGNRLEPSALHFLEALGPVVAARLELAQLRQRFQHLRLADPATDLPSGVQFEHAMGRMTCRPGQPCTVLMVQVEGFEDHQRRLGSDGGDALLRQVASRLLATSRRSSFVAKLAGASFGLIVPDVHGEAAGKLGQRLADELARQPMAAAGGQAVAVQIGVASFPEDAVRSDALLEMAKARLAAAGRGGSGRVVTSSVGDRTRHAG